MTVQYPLKFLRTEAIQDTAVRDTLRMLVRILEQMHYQINNTIEAYAPWTTIRKTADESRNTTTVLAPDSTLVVPMEANSVYAIRSAFHYYTPAAADFKYRHAGPAAPTLVLVTRGDKAPAGALSFTTDEAYSSADVALTSLSAGHGFVCWECIIQNGANAGNFEFQWAQNTSDAADTIVRAGSYLSWVKI